MGHRYGRLRLSHTPKEDTNVCHPRVTEWTTIIQPHLPHLTKPHATVLALWSLGDGAGPLLGVDGCQCVPGNVGGPQRTCRAPAVARVLLRGHGQTRDGALRARRGAVLCPPAAWVVARWGGTPRPWPSMRHLGGAVYVLAVRVVSRGGALPVAWTILPATANMPGGAGGGACCARCAGRFHGLDGHRPGRPGLGCPLAVAADRPAGGHPFLRLNTGGTFRPQGQGRGVALKTLVPEPGTVWQGTGIAFKGRHRQRHCTLLACGEAGDKEPWLLLTDLPPEASTACWYGLRAWIEQGCKSTKRAGWQWHAPTGPSPTGRRACGCAVAVATLWLLSVGGEAEETIPVSTVPDVTALVPGQPRTRRATRLRLVSVFRRGWNLLLVALLDQAPLPLGRFVPAPWPAVPVPEEATPSLPELALPQAARPQAAGATRTCMRVKIWA